MECNISRLVVWRMFVRGELVDEIGGSEGLDTSKYENYAQYIQKLVPPYVTCYHLSLFVYSTSERTGLTLEGQYVSNISIPVIRMSHHATYQCKEVGRFYFSNQGSLTVLGKSMLLLIQFNSHS